MILPEPSSIRNRTHANGVPSKTTWQPGMTWAATRAIRLLRISRFGIGAQSLLFSWRQLRPLSNIIRRPYPRRARPHHAGAIYNFQSGYILLRAVLRQVAASARIPSRRGCVTVPVYPLALRCHCGGIFRLVILGLYFQRVRKGLASIHSGLSFCPKMGGLFKIAHLEKKRVLVLCIPQSGPPHADPCPRNPMLPEAKKFF
jgi:hypothetical protein